MQKILIGVLSLVAIYLAAANARLGERLRLLEERAKAAEARLRPGTARPAPAETLAPRGLPEKPEAAPALAASAPRLPAVPPPAPAPFVRAAEGVRGEAKSLTDNFSPTQLDVVLSNAEGTGQEQAGRAVQVLLKGEMLRLHQAMDLEHVDRAFPGQVEAPSAGPRVGYLGVSASNASGGGAEISQVMPDSAASAFGLKAGDVILDLNGEPISDLAGLTAKIRATFEGTPVVLKINRGGTEMYQSVVMGGRR
jgi:hypothetical protein